MFRNLIAYPLPHGWPYSAAGTAELLARRTFQPCGPQDAKAAGFVPPRDESDLCHPVAGRYLVCHQTEEKLLPAAVVTEHAELRAAEIYQHQGYHPGRRQMKEIKEQVLQELLPQAFTKKRRTLAWINPSAGWLMIDASSSNRAEDVLRDMRQALDAFPVELLRTERAPAGVMTDWLAAGEADDRFTIDHDCELVSVTEDKASVRYARHALDGDEVRRHLESGKRPILLGLTFDDRVSFLIDESLELKRILLLDILTNDREQSDSAAEQFDADFTLAAAELERAMEALVEAAGGFMVKREPDLVDQAGAGRDAMAELNDRLSDLAPDVAYDEAKRVVLEQRRPSISLVQRHLRIGYNHAARLIEQMERDGLVSALKADGTREVLAA